METNTADDVAQPLNLSVTQLKEDGRHFGRPMTLDAHLRRTIDPTTLRELENMSQYLLQEPSTSSASIMEAEDEKNENGGQSQGQSQDQGQEQGEGDGDNRDLEADDGVFSLSAMNSETEVMRAARALFSKRTNTLYHWMYPDTPKMQLKAVVANAWDAMLSTEKQFYVSQVLGKFGCLQSQLMVNPQLGIIATSQRTQRAQHPHAHSPTRLWQRPRSQARPPTTQGQPHTLPLPEEELETHVFIEELPRAQQQQYAHAFNIGRPYGRGLGPVRRRRGRPRGSSHAAVMQSIYVQRLHAVKRLADRHLQVRLPIRRHYGGPDVGVVSVAAAATAHAQAQPTVTPAVMADNEFTDDPELRNEFEKFQWTLHMVD